MHALSQVPVIAVGSYLLPLFGLISGLGGGGGGGGGEAAGDPAGEQMVWGAESFLSIVIQFHSI